MMYLRLLTLVLLLLGLVDAQKCTLCADGSEPGEGDIPGFGTCEVASTVVASLPLDSNDCRVLQAQGYINCACPTYPDDFCSVSHEYEIETLLGLLLIASHPLPRLPTYFKMCADGAFDLSNPRGRIPYLDEGNSGDGNLCENNLFEPPDDTDDCLPFERARFFCGCPNAPDPPCTLCSTYEGSQSGGTRRIPPFFNVTCNALATAYTFISGDEECAVLNSTFTVDTETFCECENATAPINTCSLCGNASLVDPTMVADMERGLTCMDFLDMAPHVTSEEYCTEIKTAYTFTCCDIDPTEPPTGSPTMSAQPTTSSPPSMAPSVSSQPTKEDVTPMPTGTPDGDMPTETPTVDSSTSSAVAIFSWVVSFIAAVGISFPLL